MDKVELFNNELAYIRNENIKQFAVEAIQILPDYFFHIPASSTGKYHPSYSLGDGGLYRHTRAAVRIALELLRIDWWGFSSDDIDLLIVSLILHDGWKSGFPQETYTKTEHPLIAVNQLAMFAEQNDVPISKEYIDMILSNISSHMGQWTKDYKTGAEVLPRPVDKFQKFVHLADYLASRKCLEMNFDVPIFREG